MRVSVGETMEIRKPAATLLKWCQRALRYLAGRNPYRPERRYMRGHQDASKPPRPARRGA
jgi:hypothetical protein